MITKLFVLPLRLGAVALAVGAALASCSSPAPEEGTNTNWITCTANDECTKVASGATCQGGVCKTLDGGVLQQPPPLPACTWSPALDGDASSRATCHAGRARVSCSLPNGVSESCVTDGTPSCPDATNTPCHYECKPTEYTVWCGGVGPGPVPDPPNGCRFLDAAPAGIAYYCCPCGGS